LKPETFIKLYKSLPSFRGDSGIETYVTRIAINLSLNELERRKRRSLLFISKSPKEFENIPNVISDTEEREIHDTIRWAVQQLAPKFRTVVVLRLINGYSVKETAGILKLPQGTILSRLARAQKKLRKLLKPLF
jgi:RNA polymerase sigma-70 factor (ECF subfamily)